MDTDQLCHTAQLICIFVFSCAKSQFSHDAAHLKKNNKDVDNHLHPIIYAIQIKRKKNEAGWS